MSVQRDICAVVCRICALNEIYECSQKYMSVHRDICALTKIYERSRKYMSAHRDICALNEIYERWFVEYGSSIEYMSDKTDILALVHRMDRLNRLYGRAL